MERTDRQRLEEGLAAHQAGRIDEAEAVYNSVLHANPNHPDALHFLGLINHQRGKHQRAAELIGQALEHDWRRPTFHINLAAVHIAMGTLEAAAESYGHVAELDPVSVEAFAALGGVLGRLGRYDEAESAYRSALALDSDNARILSGLAAALHRQGRAEEALEYCRRATKLEPASAEAQTNLGNILQTLGQLSEAELAQQAAIAAGSSDALAYYNLGNLLTKMWRLPEGMTCFERALEIDPSDPSAVGNYLLNSLYLARETEETLYQNHIKLTSSITPVRPSVNMVRDRSPDRRLRVGYLSPDFRQHSCAYFAEPLFEAHDREGFEVVAISNVSKPDDVTARFQGLADQWLDISSLRDTEAAKRIDAAELDILIDLAGFTRGSRPQVMAAKMAPIQGTWLGYPSTTGLSSIDFRLTDEVADPVGLADGFHTEKLCRLPNGFLCYRPPVDVPAVGQSSFHQAGHITFGSFNNLLKITPEVIDVWSQILDEVDGSQLVLKASSLNYPEARELIAAAFRARGVDGDRVTLHGWIPRDQNPLSLYHNIDIGLDTFPYNGTTTTLEALWMGVPVVTLCGSRHASRVGASILERLELSHFVANSVDRYVEIAHSTADDLAALDELRRSLRTRIDGSVLCNGYEFARAVEQVYRQLWSDWSAS